MPNFNINITDRIKPSGTMSLFNAVNQMRAEGADIISFTAGELHIDSPLSAKDAAIKAINENFTHYTISDGMTELRQKVAEHLGQINNQKFATNEILITNGCKQATYNVLASLIADGDEVILPVPYYTSHIRQIELLGAIPALIHASLDDNYQLSRAMLENVYSSRTKALLVTSPQNPTGAVYTDDSLRSISEFVIEHDLWLLTDEIYSGIVYPPACFKPILKLFPKLRDRLIISNGLSKSFAMTGWRVGFAAGPSSVIKLAADIQANTTSNVCSISQKAALAALTSEPEFSKTFINDFQDNRDFCFELLSKIEGLKCSNPDGAFYLFPDITAFIGKSYNGNAIESGEAIAQYLLAEQKVAVVPGDAFGAPNHLRLSFSADRDTLEKGLNRLKKGLEELS